MIAWTAPGLLLGLGALPLLWWLHRVRRRPPEVPVSALFLWATGTQDGRTVHAGRVTDPRWKLRAALLTLLVAAAAGPVWMDGVPPVIVWLDDTPHMNAREGEHTRLQWAVREIARSLRAVGSPSAEVRSLTGEERRFRLSANEPEAAVGTLVTWGHPAREGLRLPPPVSLTAGAAHWLATDGADPELVEWARRAPLSAVLQVGEATENVAILELVVRRRAGRGDAATALVRIGNLGNGSAERTIEVTANGGLAFRGEVAVGSGEEQSVQVELGFLPTEVRARLAPGDALPLDDALAVSCAALAAVPVRIEGACGVPLRRVLSLHPGVVAGSGAGTLGVACGPDAPARPGNWIWFRPAPTAAGQPDPGQWAAGAALVGPLPPSAPRTGSAGGDPRTPRLMVGGETVLLMDDGDGPGSRQVEVHLPPDWDGDHRRHEYPQFVAELLDLAAGRPLLDPLAAGGRARNAFTIAPRAGLPVISPRLARSTSGVPLAGLPLAGAVVLLLMDLLGRPRGGMGVPGSPRGRAERGG